MNVTISRSSIVLSYSCEQCSQLYLVSEMTYMYYVSSGTLLTTIHDMNMKRLVYNLYEDLRGATMK